MPHLIGRIIETLDKILEYDKPKCLLSSISPKGERVLDKKSIIGSYSSSSRRSFMSFAWFIFSIEKVLKL